MILTPGKQVEAAALPDFELETQLRDLGGSTDLAPGTSIDEALADYEKTMAKATADAQDSVREAARKMAEDAERQRDALAARLADQLAEAEKRIADERARAINEIGEIAGDLTKATTSRLIGSEINQDEANAAVTAVIRESA